MSKGSNRPKDPDPSEPQVPDARQTGEFSAKAGFPPLRAEMDARELLARGAAHPDLARLRKQSQEAIRAGEQRYRSLFEHMLDGFAYCQMLFDEQARPDDFVFLDVNDAFGRLTGLKDVVGRRATHVVPRIKELHPELFGIYGRVATTGSPERFEIDFKPLSLYLSVSVYCPARGFFVAVFDDITERKRAEAKLQEEVAERKRAEESLRLSQEAYRHLVEGSGSVILLSDKDLNITFMNRYGLEFFGYTEEELIGVNAVGTIIPKEDEDGRNLANMAEDLRLHPEKYATNAHQNRRKDGSRVWMSWANRAMRNDQGEVVEILAIGNDLTRLKRAELELEESRKKYRDLIETTSDFIWEMDSQGRYTYCSPQMERLWGLKPADMIGKTPFDLMPPETQTRAIQLFGGMLTEPRSFSGLEVNSYDGQGRLICIEIGAVPFFGKDGTLLGFRGISRDVTDRKRADAELAHTRNLLAEGQRIAHLGTFEYVAATRAIVWSEEEYRIYGLDPAAPAPSYDEMLANCIHPGDAALLHQVFTAAMQSGSVYELEHRIVRPDGGVRWVYDRANPYFDRNGKLVRYVGATLDITERKQAEQRLRDSEELFRTLANAIPQLCWMANADGWIFWYNQRWYDYTGTAPEQMEGWGWQSVHDPEMLSNVLERWRGSIATGAPFDMVFPLRGADGIYRPFLTRVMPVLDCNGKVARWFGTNTDISEQRRTEDALKKQADLLKLSYDAMIVRGIDDVIESWNLGAERLYGYNESEAVGRVTHDLLATAFPKPWHEIRTDIKVGGVWEGELRHRTRDEREVVVSSRQQLIKGSDGIERVLEVNRDITDRKQAEERLRQAQKLESLGLLAGGVAHDFNNLLVGVIGNASLVQEMLPSDHEAADLVQGIIKTGEQAAHLTRQMLAYSGKGRFVVEGLDLSSLIRDISQLARPSIPKRVQLLLDLSDDLPPVEADRGQVQQVFMNLVINAAEAIGSHEGIVTVRTGVQTVDDHLLRQHPEVVDLRLGEYVALEVRDNGCGMDKGIKTRIFDPFFSTKFTGRGLGLAAVAGIVRGHKGVILVSSEPGKGSSFTVLFPPAARPVEKRDAADPRAVAHGSGVVLVVDDERVVREMAKRALERHGYTVLVAYDGMSAIDIFRRHPGSIKLAVLDLSMPGMSGEETLHELRKIRPEVKVLVSSGYNETEAMMMFRGQHVSGFIQKPYTVAGIAEKVKLALV